MIAAKLTEAWGQQVVVENRAGAGQMIGIELAAKAAPDGYSLLMAARTLAINPVMYKKVPYDALRDFAPITQAAALPNILVAHPSLPVKNVKELSRSRNRARASSSTRRRDTAPRRTSPSSSSST